MALPVTHDQIEVGILEPGDALDDETLVRLALDSPDLFEHLYLRYVDRVYRYCFRRLGGPEVASDATSQTFTKVFANLGQFRRGSFRTWLFTIAHHVVVDEVRSRRHHDRLPEDWTIISNDMGPEDQVLGDEVRLEIRELLKKLTPDQRQVVELRLAGLSGGEIADVLGRSRASVDTAQSRAVARLRRHLQVDQDGPGVSGEGQRP